MGFFERKSAVYQPISTSLFCLAKLQFLSASVADSFGWNNRWIVRRATLEHRPTFGGQFLCMYMYVVGRSTFRHLFCIFSNMSADRLTSEIDRGSTGLSGDFNKSALYGLRKTSIVYRSISGDQANDDISQTFFVHKLKQRPLDKGEHSVIADLFT